jgi:hypothetical protein
MLMTELVEAANPKKEKKMQQAPKTSSPIC